MTDDEILSLCPPCCHCGYCCKKRMCGYGKMGSNGICEFLTDGNRCKKYSEIRIKEKDSQYPMFYGGCNSALFNNYRDEAAIRLQATELITVIDLFTRAFITAALWTEHDEEGPDEFLDANYSWVDLDPVTMYVIIEECQKFQNENAEDLKHMEQTQGGHDFLLTRNGHGAGFWDREGLPEEVGKRLTEACKEYGEFHLIVGEDGKLHIM